MNNKTFANLIQCNASLREYDFQNNERYVVIMCQTKCSQPSQPRKTGSLKIYRIVKHIYIRVVCTYNVCDVPHCTLNTSLDHPCWKCRKKPTLSCEKRKTKTQALWTNNVLFFVLIKHGILFLDVFTIQCDVSFPLIMLIHVNL